MSGTIPSGFLVKFYPIMTLNSRSLAPIGQNDPGPFSTALATKTLFGTFLHSSIFFSGLHCFHFHVTKNWHLSFKPPEGV